MTRSARGSVHKGVRAWGPTRSAATRNGNSFELTRTARCAFFVSTPEDEIEMPGKGDNRQLAQVAGHGNAPEWFLPFVRHLFGEKADAARRRSPGVVQWSAADEIVRFTEGTPAVLEHPQCWEVTDGAGQVRCPVSRVCIARARLPCMKAL